MQALKPLLFLLVAHCALIAGVGMLSTAATLVLDGQGWTPFAVGAIQSAYFAGLVLGSVAAGRWLARRGALLVFAAGAVGGSVFTLLLLLSPGPAGWVLLRLLQGGCMAWIYASVETAINQAVDNRSRGRFFGAYQFVTYGGMAVGQWLVGVLRSDARASFASVSALFAVAVLVASRCPRRPPDLDAARTAATTAPGIGSLLKVLKITPPLGFYVAAVSGVLLSAFYTVYPLVIKEVMIDVERTGKYLAAAMLMALPPQFIVAHFADLNGRARTIIQVSTVLLAALLLLAALGGELVIWTVGFVYSGLVFCIYGLGVGDVNDRVSEKLRGEAAAGLVLMFSLGGCLGPWLSGWAYAQGGISGYFLVSAAAVASMAVAGCLSLHRRREALI